MSKTQIDPWELVKQGEYGRANDIYTRLYEQDRHPSNLYNRGLTSLLIADYRAALDDFKLLTTVQLPNMRGSNDYIYQGVCYWYLNQPLPAVQAWKESLSTAYTDSAGGIEPPALLLYAAERLNSQTLRAEALEIIQKDFHAKSSGWPGVIGPFLLGTMSIAELEQAANASRSEILNIRQQCQANFYNALHALRQNNWNAFKNAIRRCASSSYGLLEHEYYMARWEVQHDFPNPAFPSQASTMF